jgi:hypothetical protein
VIGAAEKGQIVQVGRRVTQATGPHFKNQPGTPWDVTPLAAHLSKQELGQRIVQLELAGPSSVDLGIQTPVLCEVQASPLLFFDNQ